MAKSNLRFLAQCLAPVNWQLRQLPWEYAGILPVPQPPC